LKKVAAFNRNLMGYCKDPVTNLPKEPSNQLSEGSNYKLKIRVGI
jgi:hypothetical protein